MSRPSYQYVKLAGLFCLYRRSGWNPRDAYRAACRDAGVSADRCDRMALRNLRDRLKAD
jgi:hypothetical protein